MNVSARAEKAPCRHTRASRMATATLPGASRRLGPRFPAFRQRQRGIGKGERRGERTGLKHSPKPSGFSIAQRSRKNVFVVQLQCFSPAQSKRRLSSGGCLASAGLFLQGKRYFEGEGRSEKEEVLRILQSSFGRSNYSLNPARLHKLRLTFPSTAHQKIYY